MNIIYCLGLGISYSMSTFDENRSSLKASMYMSYIFLLVGSLIVISDSHVSFTISRFLVGCASAWFGNVVSLLINKSCTLRTVPRIIASLVTFAARNVLNDWAWRDPSVRQLLLPALALPGLLIPESPRWLIFVDRVEQLTLVVTLHLPWSNTTTAIRMESDLADASYMESWKKPGNRHLLLISVSLGIFSQTAGITSVTQQILIAGLLQVWNLIFAGTVALLPMLVAYILVTALSGSFAETVSSSTGIAVIPFLFVFFAGYAIALTPFLAAYPCEIWPYRLRRHGRTVTWISVVVANFFNTYVNPIALESIGRKYYFVFIVVLIPMGYHRHMTVIFDGEDAAPSSAEIAQRAYGVKEKAGLETTEYEEKV
ncbi:hypothetical protein T440DRAFT_500967 [Plenodomus tracheiphilus IPT5]|uniref:MFS general substrate transporter n=1 Tax=Plenodomus tracheiphilus IPT5 TaxID=1408161 RepID=A0A6A7AYT1_9PLEO|nr:hypothetical protein T440DRAFT_500967 [Plenodomus tracheiphilus IPT5]